MDYEPQYGSQRLPPCDSYFVESMDHDDEGVFLRQQKLRKESLARMNAETQADIAADLSSLVAEEYQADILDHMEVMESETLPDVASIDIQTEIQWFMRSYLLEFLIEAHTAFSLLPETLFLTINLLDRYCSRRVVYKRHYQLVGCAAMLIAAKYGDKKDRVPTVRELKAMCCNLYDEDMFIQMEWHVLQTLGWVIGHPTVDSFLQLVLQENAYEDPAAEHMARYIAEIAMFHKDFVSVRPSVMARTSLALARHILNRPQASQSEWAGKIDTTVLVLLSQHLYNPSQILARKYAGPEVECVSTILQEFMAHQAMLARHSMPPTPPSDKYQASNRMSIDGDKYDPMTPQKNYHGKSGMMTPPITPNGDYYADNTFPAATSSAHRVPVTPPPGQHQYYVS